MTHLDHTPFPRHSSQRPASENSLDAIRTILLAGEQAQIRDLETQLALARAATLQAETHYEERVQELAAQLEALRHAQQDSDVLAKRIAPVMVNAIKQQIRQDRQSMIEALVPIIGSVVRRGIGEFIRELQRNVDARLRSVFQLRGWLRLLWARGRGVEPSSLALRDALPFTLEELFVIHRHSGLLLAHDHHHTTSSADTDLISGMLTAIRHFTQDAFGRGRSDGELDEIQYGDQRIIIRGGSAAYVAAVIRGIEPTGFRASVQGFIDDLHLYHENLLRSYTGEVGSVLPIQQKLADFAIHIEQLGNIQPGIRPFNATEPSLLRGVMACLFAAAFLLCFYTIFTVRLLPVAFPGWFNAPTKEIAAASAPVVMPSPTATLTPTPLPPPTMLPTPPTLPIIIPGVPVDGVTMGPLFAYVTPDSDAVVVGIVPRNVVVQVLAEDTGWLLIEWRHRQERVRGWAVGAWVQIAGGIPNDLRTPTATPYP